MKPNPYTHDVVCWSNERLYFRIAHGLNDQLTQAAKRELELRNFNLYWSAELKRLMEGTIK